MNTVECICKHTLDIMDSCFLISQSANNKIICNDQIATFLGDYLSRASVLEDQSSLVCLLVSVCVLKLSDDPVLK